MRQPSWDKKAGITYVSHPPEKSTYFYEDQTNFKENLQPLIKLTSRFHVGFDLCFKWVQSSSQGNNKTGELAVLRTQCPDVFSTFSPLMTCLIYMIHTWMDAP